MKKYFEHFHLFIDALMILLFSFLGYCSTKYKYLKKYDANSSNDIFAFSTYL